MEIIKRYITKNPCYTSNTKKNKTGYMQHSTGAPGAMAETWIARWNSPSVSVGVEFVIDDTGIYQLLPIGIRSWHGGGSSNNTHVGCEICEPYETRLLSVNWQPLSYGGKNNTEWAVKRLQEELIQWGYDPNGVDGSFGPGCKAAVEKFQADNGLNVDGSVGKATLAKLQTRQGSLLKYNPDEVQDYFEDVYRKAVYTCAYVIQKLNSEVNENNVLSHAEGYKKGIASNHADVGHWFPQHGKSMDDFRADVKKYIATGVLPFEPIEENKPIEEDKGNYIIYVVQDGDTWWNISKTYLGAGNRYIEILEYNDLSEGASLNVGDKIKIPKKNNNTEDNGNSDINAKEPPEAASDWAQEAWTKAYNKGVLDGYNPKGNVTREMLAVILDALGLLD